MSMNKRFRWDRLLIVMVSVVSIARIGKTMLGKDKEKSTSYVVEDVQLNDSPAIIENGYTITGGDIELIANSSTDLVKEATTVATVATTASTKIRTTTKTTTAQPTTTSSFYSTRLNRYMSDYEMYLLTMICCSEAGFESYEGKVAVVATVLNRMESSIFPDGIYEVIFQKYQFSSATNGVFHNSTDELRYEDISSDMLNDAQKAVKAALNGEDPTTYATGGALFFYNPDYCSEEENAMRANISCTLRIGNHIFYREWD